MNVDVNENEAGPFDAPVELPEDWAGVLFHKDSDQIYLALPYDEHEDGTLTVPGWAILPSAVYRTLQVPVIQQFIRLEMQYLMEDLEEAVVEEGEEGEA